MLDTTGSQCAPSADDGFHLAQVWQCPAMCTALCYQSDSRQNDMLSPLVLNGSEQTPLLKTKAIRLNLLLGECRICPNGTTDMGADCGMSVFSTCLAIAAIQHSIGHAAMNPILVVRGVAAKPESGHSTVRTW